MLSEIQRFDTSFGRGWRENIRDRMNRKDEKRRGVVVIFIFRKHQVNILS